MSSHAVQAKFKYVDEATADEDAELAPVAGAAVAPAPMPKTGAAELVGAVADAPAEPAATSALEAKMLLSAALALSANRLVGAASDLAAGAPKVN